MKKYIYLLIALTIVLIAVGLTACGGEGGDTQETTQATTVSKYDVNINIECRENLFFDKYDVKVFLDSTDELGTIEHGDSAQYERQLEKGSYEIRVENEEDDTVDGTASFSVSENTNVKYKIKCTDDQIEIEEVKQINPPVDANEYKKMKYEKAEKQFEKSGFTNIRTKEVFDLSADQLKKKSHVKKISIDGEADYSKEDKFFEDSKVVIKYHLAKKIHPPRSDSSCEGKNYKKIVKEFKDAGFINVKTKTTGNDKKSKVGKVDYVTIKSNFWFSKKDMIPLDKKVTVYRFVYEKSDSDYTEDYEDSDYSEDDGDSGYSYNDDSFESKRWAQKAFEAVGEYNNPYGFKCHWLMDCINAEERSDGSWFFKVGVTIENEYGNKRNTVAEGTVSTDGTVTHFYVY